MLHLWFRTFTKLTIAMATCTKSLMSYIFFSCCSVFKLSGILYTECCNSIAMHLLWKGSSKTELTGTKHSSTDKSSFNYLGMGTITTYLISY